MPNKPNLKFLLSHPAHFFSLGFGSGLFPIAPGTAGTAVAIPLYFMINDIDLVPKLFGITVMFLFGIFFCHRTGKALGVSDHGSIVWDEIVAMMLVLTFAPDTVIAWMVAFFLFRLFDIWKPYPIQRVDAMVKGGWGVMLDDLLAAIYAIGIIKGLQWTQVLS